MPLKIGKLTNIEALQTTIEKQSGNNEKQINEERLNEERSWGKYYLYASFQVPSTHSNTISPFTLTGQGILFSFQRISSTEPVCPKKLRPPSPRESLYHYQSQHPLSSQALSSKLIGQSPTKLISKDLPTITTQMPDVHITWMRWDIV